MTPVAPVLADGGTAAASAAAGRIVTAAGKAPGTPSAASMAMALNAAVAVRAANTGRLSRGPGRRVNGHPGYDEHVTETLTLYF